MAPAGQRHGWIAMNLLTSLNGSVQAQRLGVVYAAETGFLLATALKGVQLLAVYLILGLAFFFIPGASTS